jgi:hypothetical protein
VSTAIAKTNEQNEMLQQTIRNMKLEAGFYPMTDIAIACVAMSAACIL